MNMQGMLAEALEADSAAHADCSASFVEYGTLDQPDVVDRYNAAGNRIYDRWPAHVALARAAAELCGTPEWWRAADAMGEPCCIGCNEYEERGTHADDCKAVRLSAALAALVSGTPEYTAAFDAFLREGP